MCTAGVGTSWLKTLMLSWSEWLQTSRRWLIIWTSLTAVATPQIRSVSLWYIYFLFACMCVCSLPYLILPSWWIGYYTCPVLRLYLFGSMRIPDVSVSHGNQLWSRSWHRSWKFIIHLAAVTCSMLVVSYVLFLFVFLFTSGLQILFVFRALSPIATSTVANHGSICCNCKTRTSEASL